MIVGLRLGNLELADGVPNIRVAFGSIVEKHRHIVRVPMGKEQAAVYKFHLEARYRDVNGRPAIGAQLQALRIAAANPTSHLLVRPEGDGKTRGEPTKQDQPYSQARQLP